MSKIIKKLTKPTPMSIWDIGLIKIAMLWIGIAIGAKLHRLVEAQAGKLFLGGLGIGIWALHRWLKK